ncbi:MAG: hypothetical protein LW601_03900 [Cryomorphaceae bacterium]|jgi:transcriptional regulator with XRE-family HTH domain|nr:hypothetical protein [Cryomorphaceae bacterium]
MESIPSENQRFKDWMERTHRSAGTVAKDLGLSRAVLSHILTGRNRLSLTVVQHAARTYSDFDLAFVVLGGTSKTASESALTRPSDRATSKPEKAIGTRRNPAPALSYDQLILVRDGKFQVLVPEAAEL